ncbi:thyroid receptor-interacting protein 11-like isoform X1 [Formica exsecta]|uniref:thyroid receptor-interacting protein 11-like isoform X1 n=2 Tax=Formica exsecta TaxID=72781 RepID=UPI0011418E8A|nr:thyroid receptor-interacting protein 11-like isoform X1 [Formica exsecta]
MAWFGDSLSSLSNLKGQITNFTKDVLSDGIVEEIDERSKALNEANERCNQLQDLLNSKDAEISLLRRQNTELQSAVIEMNAKYKESKDTNHIDEIEGVFCDPSCVDNRNAKNQNVRQLQEQLAQATVKVRELEYELKHVQKVANTSLRDDLSDGHQKAEVVRARQDMMNRIIQMEEKTREAERNAKHIQLDEASLINDFRSVISKLNSREKFDLVSGALKALQIESETRNEKDREKSNEQLEKVDGIEYNTLTLKHHLDNISLQQNKSSDTIQESLSNKREIILQQRIEKLQNENKDLLDAMEKLDEEHTQSIEKLLSLREETNKKHRSLQSAYEQLSIDYNKSQKRIIEFRNSDLKLDENAYTETSHRSVQTDNLDNLDKHTQIMVPFQRDDIVSKTSILDDITRKIKMILKSYTISTIEPGETIFEAIAKQYVDTKWKLDILERKVTEITRDLKETKETKDVLQIECEELQSHIDSLLLENQVLKSSLPSIPEASEERVVSLETEVESLREEAKRLSVENETIREINTNLTLAVQDKGMFSTSHDHLQKDVNRESSDSSVKENVKFPICLEKNNSSNENAVSVEQIKLNPENITRELKCFKISKTKLLKNNDLASLQDQDIVDKLANESKEDLLQKNTQLYDTTLRESDLQEENDYQLHDLQERLDIANCEKFDLENDILHMEKELDAMQIQMNIKQSQITKLNQDNDRLIKENISLLEQLTATHDESLDKIELLNTEMSLLQQEHKDLKQGASIYKEELTRTKDKLYEAQERYVKLEKEHYALKARYEQIELEKKNIHTQAMRMEELENELCLKESFIEKLNFLRNRSKLLEQEIKDVRTKETQLLKSREHTSEISSPNIDSANNRLQEEPSTVEDNLIGKENIIHVKAEILDLTPKDTSIIDEEKREKDVLKVHNKQMTSEITELRSKLQSAIENSKESAEMAKQTIEGLSHLIREKDQEMSILQTEVERAQTIIAQTSNELVAIRNQKDELERIVSAKHNENLQYQKEIEKLIQRVNEQTAQIQRLISEKTASEIRDENVNLKERQKDRIHQIVDQQSGQSAEIVALNKKCDALEVALRQEQSNNRILQNQLTESRNREASSVKELERLRTHLVEIESSYTEEALIAEKSRQELETRLLQAEEKVKNSSTAFTSANIRANQQIETLQQQITLITQQRDHIQTKLSAAEDNIQLQSASLTNLQIVLEQFQQDKERDIESATEKIQCQLNEAYKKQDEFLNEISILKQQLFEAKECLQAASRLSEQLEKKDEEIERLDEEVARLTTSLNFAEQRVKEAMEHDEEKIDKILIKNLLLGYLSSATSDKSAILRVFANVLNFTDSEKDKTGLNNGTAQSGRFLRSHDKSDSVPSKYQEASLSTAFVRFLESESKPKPQLPPLPIVNSSSSRSGYNKQRPPSSAQSTLLLSNVALPTFPDFIPARNTGSILKEVLKDS